MFGIGELSVVNATVAATGIIFIVVLIKRITAKDDDRKRYPPSIPILSLIFSILKEGVGSLPEFFMRYAEKLGPVMSCNMGGRMVVILNNRKALTEALLKQSEIFAHRFELWEEKNVSNPDFRGIIFARYNENFRKYHKICLSILKEFGLGDKRVSETRILHEMESMIDEIVKINGQPFDPKSMTVLSTSNVVLSILFSKKFISVENNRRSLLQSSKEIARNLDLALSMAPLLRFLPIFRRKVNSFSQGHRRLMRAIEEGIEVTKADKTESTFVQRFVDVVGPDYNHEDLAYILRDLCFASLETVSSVLLWAMVELANNMKIQTRLQAEIDDLVPGNSLPCLDDTPNLPYAEAVILELLRRRTVAPLPAPHSACKDTEVLGNFIPKGSLVIVNIYSTHMDPMTWKDPKNFDPERFLDKDGNISGSERLVPFGLGKRSCLGEIIGRQTMFLFLTSLVHRFDIRPPEDQDSINVREMLTVTMNPTDFKVRLIPRKKDLDAHAQYKKSIRRLLMSISF